MTNEPGRADRAEPTFIDVLEHIGSGGVIVDRSEPQRARPRERITSRSDDERERTRSETRDRRGRS
jgi:hypothetical protein